MLALKVSLLNLFEAGNQPLSKYAIQILDFVLCRRVELRKKSIHVDTKLFINELGMLTVILCKAQTDHLSLKIPNPIWAYVQIEKHWRFFSVR